MKTKEMNDQKFDDTVFSYKENGRNLFFQHRINKKQKLIIDDLDYINVLPVNLNSYGNKLYVKSDAPQW